MVVDCGLMKTRLRERMPAVAEAKEHDSVSRRNVRFEIANVFTAFAREDADLRTKR